MRNAGTRGSATGGIVFLRRHYPDQVPRVFSQAAKPPPLTKLKQNNFGIFTCQSLFQFVYKFFAPDRSNFVCLDSLQHLEYHPPPKSL